MTIGMMTLELMLMQGDYVTDVECWLVAQGIEVEVSNLGLGGETATDLTTNENSSHFLKLTK